MLLFILCAAILPFLLCIGSVGQGDSYGVRITPCHCRGLPSGDYAIHGQRLDAPLPVPATVSVPGVLPQLMLNPESLYKL